MKPKDIKEILNSVKNSSGKNYSSKTETSVSIGGKVFESVRNISVINGVVKVNGKVVSESKEVLHIEVTGTLENLQTDLSVNCEDIAGDLHAGGSVNCDSVKGNINAGGSVNCDTVGGNVSAGGSIVHG